MTGHQRSPATGINFYNFYSAQRHNSCSKTMLLVFHFKSSGAYFSVMQKSGLFSFYLHFWNRRWLNMEKQKSNFGSPKFIVLGFPVPWRCFCFCTSPLPQDCPTEFYRSWLDGIHLWNIGNFWSLFSMLTVLYRPSLKFNGSWVLNFFGIMSLWCRMLHRSLIQTRSWIL